MDISIIVPYRDRRDNLSILLKQFEIQQNFNGSYEIIIVDLGSTQNIGHLIDKKAYIKHIYVGYNGIFSRAWACNIGAKNSKYDFLWFVDADCIPHPKLLHLIEKNFMYEEDFAINVPVIFLNSNNTFNILKKGHYSFEDFLKFRNDRSSWLSHHIDGTSQVVVKREMFFRLGGYDERFVGHGYEDMLLHDQIAELIPKYWSKWPDKKEIKWSIEKNIILTHLYHGQRNYKSRYMSRYTKNLRLYKNLVAAKVMKNNVDKEWGRVDVFPTI